ncbi:MAG: hypothetical protein R3Y13_04350 [bacterium]
MDNYFVNQAVEKAFSDYVISRNHKNGIIHNSFLVITIRGLISIYGETEIMNAYNSRDEEQFRSILLKYKFSIMKLNKFFSDLDTFYYNDQQGIIPNTIFVVIQRFMIDMLMMKKINYEVSEMEMEYFKNFLYFPSSSNPLLISYNFLHSRNNFEIVNYYADQDKLYVKISYNEPKILLAPEAYKIIDKNYTDVCLLTAEDVKLINEEVYKTLAVDKKSTNFEYLYDLALYNYYNQKMKLTSGNGYIDILLIMGMLSTVVMTFMIVTFLIL